MSVWDWHTVAESLNNYVSISTIIIEVCEERDLQMFEVLSKSRKAHLVEARKEIARRARKKGHTLTRIGEVLGRDHTTIVHYTRQPPNEPKPK